MNGANVATVAEDWVLDLEVVAMARESTGVISVRLADPEGRRLPAWEPGAHIDLFLPEAVRQYSLCGEPGDRASYRVAVLREQESRGGSAYVHERLRVGDRLEVGGPRNHFGLVDADRYLLIAGGIGITPLLAMLVALHEQCRDWQLLYGGRTRRSMAFLDKLVPHGDRVSVWPQDELGLLDLDQALGRPQAGTAVYCCGPEGLLEAVEQRCQEWAPGALHLERFAPRPLDSSLESQPFDLVLARSGERLTVSAGQTALEALEDAGFPVPSACREGVCGSCQTRVLAGVPDHRDSLTDPASTDVVMPCISRARSDELVLDL
jgi:ferredoxin-NADP reductase